MHFIGLASIDFSYATIPIFDFSISKRLSCKILPFIHSLVEHMKDNLRVAGVKTNKHRGVSLSCFSFVSHKDPPSLVTLKSGKVWLLG